MAVYLGRAVVLLVILWMFLWEGWPNELNTTLVTGAKLQIVLPGLPKRNVIGTRDLIKAPVSIILPKADTAYLPRARLSKGEVAAARTFLSVEEVQLPSSQVKLFSRIVCTGLTHLYEIAVLRCLSLGEVLVWVAPD